MSARSRGALLVAWHVLCVTVVIGFGKNETKSGKVKLKLRYSGPGVLDSSMTFDAVLLRANGSVMDKTLYIYDWMDNASILEWKQRTNHTKSQIQNIYYSDWVHNPGPYQMTVNVYEKTPDNAWKRGPKVTNGSMTFILTDTLNGQLFLHQNLSVKRKERTFATGVPIILSAHLTDTIDLQNTTYSWHVDNSSAVNTTLDPHYEVVFDDVGAQYLGVTTNGSCMVQIPWLGKRQVNKTGLWEDFIWLKDQVSNMSYVGNLTYLEGDLLTANISCEGSSPFHICSNISLDPLHPDNCTEFQTTDDCNAHLSQNMTQAGNFTVIVVVKNDVSVQSLSVRVAVNPPVLPAGGTPLVIIACVIIGLVLLTLIMYSYKKEKRKPARKMETADFDFHPFQSTSSQGSHWSLQRLRETVYSWFSGHRDSSERDRSFRVLQVRNYGAISSTEEDVL